MPTLEEINAMTDEEVANLNKTLWKRALKRTAITVAVLAAANVVVHVIDKKMS